MNRNRLVAAVAVIAALTGGWWWRHRRQRPEPATVAAADPVAADPGRRDRPPRNAEIGASARVMIDDDPRGSLRLWTAVAREGPFGRFGEAALIEQRAGPPRRRRE